MNNMERIAIARLANNIPEDIIVESMAEWNRRKRKVIKGQHPVFRIQIWVPNKSNDEEETTDSNDMNLWWTNFFTEEQTEPMPEDFKLRKKSKKRKKR